MKKALPLIALSASAFAAADRCAPEMPMCYSPDDCQRCYCLGPSEIIANAPVCPHTCNGDISITVAGFYWRAQQDGLEYAIDNAVRISNINVAPLTRVINNLIDAHYLAPDFKWNFGFKLGLAYCSPCDGWDIGVLWTNYHGKASSHVEAEPEDNHTLIPIWSAFQGQRATTPPSTPGVFANDIQTSWKLDLNLIDMELGRAFWVSRYLSFRPHIGFRLGFLEQSFHLEHRGGTFLANSELQPNFNDSVDLGNDFKGIGIRGGFDTNWHLGCGWSLYGNLAAAIVYGKFNLDHNEYIRLAESPFTKREILQTDEHFRASRAMLDLGLGVQWMGMICDCKYGLTVQLGWEQHLFFHQNQLWRVKRFGASSPPPPFFPNDTGQNVAYQQRGTLSTEGVTLTFRFDF